MKSINDARLKYLIDQIKRKFSRVDHIHNLTEEGHGILMPEHGGTGYDSAEAHAKDMASRLEDTFSQKIHKHDMLTDMTNMGGFMSKQRRLAIGHIMYNGGHTDTLDIQVVDNFIPYLVIILKDFVGSGAPLILNPHLDVKNNGPVYTTYDKVEITNDIGWTFQNLINHHAAGGEDERKALRTSHINCKFIESEASSSDAFYEDIPTYRAIRIKGWNSAQSDGDLSNPDQTPVIDLFNGAERAYSAFVLGAALPGCEWSETSAVYNVYTQKEFIHYE